MSMLKQMCYVLSFKGCITFLVMAHGPWTNWCTLTTPLYCKEQFIAHTNFSFAYSMRILAISKHLFISGVLCLLSCQSRFNKCQQFIMMFANVFFISYIVTQVTQSWINSCMYTHLHIHTHPYTLGWKCCS